jgi:tetratricopeptide (TPR) repeat protein
MGSSRPSQPASPTPSLIAPKWEKQLWTVTIRRPSPSDIGDVAKLDPRSHHVVAFLETVMHLLPSADLPSARRRVEWLWSSGYDSARDPFLNRYIADVTIVLGLTAEITAALPADHDALGLLLAELRQATGDIALAIDCVESLTPSSPTAVSLAELYASQNRWRDIVDLTNDLENDDELLTYLLIQRGVALRELRMFDAARESFKRALAARSRPAILRHLGLVERGQCYLIEGKRAMARKDFQKVLAENANYPGLADHLVAVGE